MDPTGYVLVTANGIRLLDARAAHLARAAMVDWNALLGLMSAAAKAGFDPFQEAVKVQARLFTSKPIFLGVEESLKRPDVPCGLKTDAERARHVKHRAREMLNSRGEWERYPAPLERPLREVFIAAPGVDGTVAVRSVLTDPLALEKTGQGSLVGLGAEGGMTIMGDP